MRMRERGGERERERERERESVIKYEREPDRQLRTD